MVPIRSSHPFVGSRNQGRLSRSRGSIFWPATEEFRPREATGPIRILIVDDHQVLRQGLRAILELEPDVTVVGEAEDGYQGVQFAHELRPDVVIMDLQMPVLDGIAATTRILAELPGTEVVIQSADIEAPSIVAGVRAGALGILGKRSPPAELMQAVRAARDGRVYLSCETATKLMRQMQALDDLETLSEIELEVLRLLVRGETNAQIAQALDLYDIAVATHVSYIMTKLRVHSRIEVVLRATRLGLVTPDATVRVGAQNQVRQPIARSAVST